MDPTLGLVAGGLLSLGFTADVGPGFFLGGFQVGVEHRRDRMKRTGWNAIVAVLMGGAVLAGLAGGAAANSSAFSWTMRWRYVGGDRNSRYHALDAGALTINGKLWIYEKARASASSPMTIQIEVLKENDEKNVLCTLTVVPSTILNDKKEFSKTCGRIETGKYWVRITKPGATSHDGDGWHNQGAGTLATTN